MRRVVNCFLPVMFAGLPVASIAQDWSGGYSGLGLSASRGTETEAIDGAQDIQEDIKGNQTALFAGYALQRGKIVYGGEVAYNHGRVVISEQSPDLNYIDRLFDLKARVGYSFGKVLVFGSAGWARADTYYAGVDGADEPLHASGLSYGLGANYAVDENWFIGGEVLQRKLNLGEGDIPGFEEWSTQWKFTTVQLRVGMRF